MFNLQKVRDGVGLEGFSMVRATLCVNRKGKKERPWGQGGMMSKQATGVTRNLPPCCLSCIRCSFRAPGTKAMSLPSLACGPSGLKVEQNEKGQLCCCCWGLSPICSWSPVCLCVACCITSSSLVPAGGSYKQAFPFHILVRYLGTVSCQIMLTL